MTPLRPWAIGPFELLLHAEGHLRAGDDFDRRIALISFDNTIEATIAVYLSLNPAQRGNRHYDKGDLVKWSANYHAKLDFLQHEIIARELTWEIDRGDIMWCHDHRNDQYHGGRRGVPDRQVLDIGRRAALWVFGMLFEVQEMDDGIEKALTPAPAPERNPAFDNAIDGLLDTIPIGDQLYSPSEVLFFVDYQAYRDLGMRLSEERPDAGVLH